MCSLSIDHRFLRMRAFNVPKAKEMFLNMVKWRADFGVDAIVKVNLGSNESGTVFSDQ
jgi:hypothetical protein